MGSAASLPRGVRRGGPRRGRGCGLAQGYAVYVSNEKDNTITVLDSEKLAVTATWKVGRRPRGITTSLDGKWLYVCASDDHRIDVIDTATGKTVRSLKSGPDPEL